MKPSIKTILPLALLGLTAVTATHAATSDGKTFGVSAGWLHVMPQSSAQGVTNTAANDGLILSGSRYSAGAGFEVQKADTIGLTLDYFVNDNVSLEMVLGAPPKMKLSGAGLAEAPIPGASGVGPDLSKLDKVASTKAYTPTFLAKYQFGTVDSKIRPYLGGGVMYAHFSDIDVDSDRVNAALNTGALALMKPSLGNVTVEDAFAPVVVAGVDYNINKDWFATASVSYAHLSTNAKLEILDKNKDLLITGKSKVEINPIVTFVGLGYRF